MLVVGSVADDAGAQVELAAGLGGGGVIISRPSGPVMSPGGLYVLSG